MYRYQSQLGSACHQRAAGQVPLCAITTLNHNEILFAHVPQSSEWVIQSVACSLQRFWNASSALINLTCASTEKNYFAPPLPLVTLPEDKIEHPLGEEDHICIWMGYVDSTYYSGSLSDLMTGESPALLRVFTGVIDSVGVVGTDKGFKYTIQCRDRMRYLMDTQVSLAPFDIQNDRNFLNSALGGKEDNVARSAAILKLAQLGVGYVDLGAGADTTANAANVTNINGLKILQGEIFDLANVVLPTSDPKNKSSQKINYPPPDYYYNYGTKPLAGGVKTKTLDLAFHPKFNITTGRLPFSTETVAREYTIEQQIPIELIKFLANQEAYPTDLFSSPQDGNFYYSPRGAELGGLSDPKRFYRTYYYRFLPPGVGEPSTIESLSKKYPAVDLENTIDPDAQVKGIETQSKETIDPVAPFKLMPDWCQGIHNWREERTTNSMYTNFLIANNSPNNVKGKDNNVIMMHMVVRPPFLAGRVIGGRNMYVIDDNISTPLEAIAVGSQQARIHGKQLSSASMTIIGDPSLTVGELIQVVGSPLHSELNNLEALVAERQGALDYMARERESFSDLMTKLKGTDRDRPQDDKSFAITGGQNSPNPSGAFIPGEVNKPTTLAGNSINPNNKGSTRAFAEAATTNDAVRVREGKDLPIGSTTVISESSTQASSESAPSTPSTPGTFDGAFAGTLAYPAAQKYPVTSPFGYRIHPITGVKRFHAGIDFGFPTGTVVTASAKGKVASASFVSGYGNYIVLDHGNGVQTRYGHNNVNLVKAGDTVEAGQQIARSGSTGASTGPHLHYEVKVNGKFIDPALALAGKSPELKQAFAQAPDPLPTAPAPTPTPVSENNKAEQFKYSDAGSQAQPLTFPEFVKAGRAAITKFQPLPTYKALFASSELSPNNFLATGLAWNFATKSELDWAVKNGPKYGFVSLGAYPGVKNSTDYIIYVGATAEMSVFADYIAYSYSKPSPVDLLAGDAELKKIYAGLNGRPKTSAPPSTDSASSTASASNSGSTPASTKLPNDEQRLSHYSQPPVSVFRIDGVRHDYNSAGKGGYTCEVVMLPMVG